MKREMMHLALLCIIPLGFGIRGSDDDQGRTDRTTADKGNDVATAMVVDPKGGEFVTGYSKGANTGYDFQTVKYNRDGKLVWARRYDGPANGDDRPSAIVLDGKGNVYVTGSSAGAGSGSDYLTLKYDPTGHLEWARRYNGNGNGFDRPTSIAVDTGGNVCVTGFSLSSGSGYDCVTIKYDTEGKELWSQVYNGPTSGDDYGVVVRLDRLGDAYVAGYSKRSKKAANYLLIKYDPAGKPLWTRNFGEKRNQDAKATGLALSAGGTVCVTGYADGSHGNSDIITVAYDPAGKQLWTHRYDGPGQGEDRPTGVLADAHGDLIVFGGSQGSAASGQDFVTYKLTEGGKPRWESRYNGTGSGDDRPADAAIDAEGCVLVTGYSLGIDSGTDILTVRYDGSGKQLWSQRYNGEANDVDRPVAVGVDDTGAVYVAGYSWAGKGAAFDYVLIKYSNSGTPQWVRRFDGSGSIGQRGFEGSRAQRLID